MRFRDRAVDVGNRPLSPSYSRIPRRTREGERERGRIAAADSLPLAARVTEERGSATKVNIAEAQPSRRVI